MHLPWQDHCLTQKYKLCIKVNITFLIVMRNWRCQDTSQQRLENHQRQDRNGKRQGHTAESKTLPLSVTVHGLSHPGHPHPPLYICGRWGFQYHQPHWSVSIHVAYSCIHRVEISLVCCGFCLLMLKLIYLHELSSV